MDVCQNGRFTRDWARLLASTAVRTTRRPVLRLPLVAVVLLSLLAGACGDDGELGGPTVGGTPAASIGDHAVTNGDLEDEVEAWASNPAVLQAIGLEDVGAAGRRGQDLVSFVLGYRVVSEQARLMLAEARRSASDGEIDLAELGVDGEALSEPSDQEVDSILEELDRQFTTPTGEQLFQGFDQEFRRGFARDLAYQQRLEIVLQLGIEAPDVEINPRYGTAELLQGGIAQVLPPTGPRPAPVSGV